MIYVYNHDKAITFWTKNLDFKVVEDTEELEQWQFAHRHWVPI
jgi:lactoylglutathione lyase